jgi:hypothetical protein
MVWRRTDSGPEPMSQLGQRSIRRTRINSFAWPHFKASPIAACAKIARLSRSFSIQLVNCPSRLTWAGPSRIT